MSKPMTLPGEKQPRHDWWLESAYRIASSGCVSESTSAPTPFRYAKQVQDTIELVRIIWEEMERRLEVEP